MIRKAIGAIIFQKDKFLLINRGMIMNDSGGMDQISPEWDTLKGGIDDGETPEQTLMRELYEETGSRDYKIIKVFDEKIFYPLPKSTGFTHQDVTMFLVEYFGEASELKPVSEEVSRVEFFTRDEATRKLKYPETKSFFKKYA